ncbi:hypothetical protein A3K63_03005 [Candidatus Micrarchaeota archaeon RBG_16_49_10]|nr:MAG: hypothetical protein A3K63_03005 [Candidatus Micrarchaeota archaeon RBG_16_49_10]
MNAKGAYTGMTILAALKSGGDRFNEHHTGHYTVSSETPTFLGVGSLRYLQSVYDCYERLKVPVVPHTTERGLAASLIGLGLLVESDGGVIPVMSAMGRTILGEFLK